MDKKPCIIYARVSSMKQVTNGHGLDSQVHRCKQYAENKNYEVVKVFQDEAVSGGVFERKAITEMLYFLAKNKHHNYVVIFDDIKRLARDTVVYLNLKKEILSYGATIECLNFSFEESPEGRFIETIMAAQAELERTQNRRQVKQKMRARIENGYWCLYPPCAYKFEKSDVHGKILTPIKKDAQILAKALKGFANGQFINQEEMRKFLEKHHFLSKKKIYPQLISRILREPLYAGYIEYPKWDISLRKGHHEALITYAEYEQIQKQLRKPVNYVNTQAHKEFPLRQLIFCEKCGKSMTSSTPRGKSGKQFLFYTCNNTKCSATPKNIKKDYLEKDYVELLQTLSVEPKYLAFLKDSLKKHYAEKTLTYKELYNAHINKIEYKKSQIDTLLEQISITKDVITRQLYEDKIKKLSIQIDEMKKVKLIPIEDFEAILKEVSAFLMNPAKIWQNAPLEQQKQIHTRIFKEPIAYSKDNGFGTPKTSSLFKLNSRCCSDEFHLVDFLKSEWNEIMEELMNLKISFNDK